jgi:hypothetical protein
MPVAHPASRSIGCKIAGSSAAGCPRVGGTGGIGRGQRSAARGTRPGASHGDWRPWHSFQNQNATSIRDPALPWPSDIAGAAAQRGRCWWCWISFPVQLSRPRPSGGAVRHGGDTSRLSNDPTLLLEFFFVNLPTSESLFQNVHRGGRRRIPPVSFAIVRPTLSTTAQVPHLRSPQCEDGDRRAWRSGAGRVDLSMTACALG